MRTGPELKEISTPVTLQGDESVFMGLWQRVLRTRSATPPRLDEVISFMYTEKLEIYSVSLGFR